jgi:hypothetical protein
MASEPLLAAFDMAVVRRGHSVRSGVLSDYWGAGCSRSRRPGWYTGSRVPRSSWG